MNKPSEPETSHRTVGRDWLTRFVQKYYLGGLIDEARWNSENGVWKVKELNVNGKWECHNGKWRFTKGKSHTKLMVTVQSNCECDLPIEAVVPTKVLLKLLESVLDEEITINVINPSDLGLEYVMPPTLEIADSGIAHIIPLSSAEHLSSQPQLLQVPKWDYASTFRTADMLNYLEYFGRGRFRSRKENYQNQHCFKFKPVMWFDFDGYHLRNILRANRDVDSFKMEVSKEGLCHLSFNGDDIQSDYYLIKYNFEQADVTHHSFRFITCYESEAA